MLTINLLQHYKLDGNPMNESLKRQPRFRRGTLSFSAAFKNQLAAIRLDKSISEVAAVQESKMKKKTVYSKHIEGGEKHAANA